MELHELDKLSIENEKKSQIIRDQEQRIRELEEKLGNLINEAYNLKHHVWENDFIDWEDESIDGCKSFDEAMEKAKQLLNQKQ